MKLSKTVKVLLRGCYDQPLLRKNRKPREALKQASSQGFLW